MAKVARLDEARDPGDTSGPILLLSRAGKPHRPNRIKPTRRSCPKPIPNQSHHPKAASVVVDHFRSMGEDGLVDG
jgi:hypothetical protein